MIPNKITSLLDKYDAEDCSFFIKNFDLTYQKETLEIEFKGRSFDESEKFEQHWLIQINNLRDYKLIYEFAESLEIKEEHPLLWEYNYIQCELYFSGIPKDPGKLFYELDTINRNLDYIKPYKYLRQYDWYDFISQGIGLLAKGPKKLLTIYAECLKKHEVESSIIGERATSYWNGDEYILESGELKLLFIGNSFVIADEFIFNDIV